MFLPGERFVIILKKTFFPLLSYIPVQHGLGTKDMIWTKIFLVLNLFRANWNRHYKRSDKNMRMPERRPFR